MTETLPTTATTTTGTATVPGTSPGIRAAPAPDLPDVPARSLHGAVLHQPLDGQRGTRRHRAGHAPVAAAAGHLPFARPHGAAHRSPPRPAGHGLRGQRRHGDRRHRAGRPVPASGARRGRARLPGLVPRARLPGGARAPARQRGRGGHRARGPGDPGRARLPHRPRRAARARAAVRAAGRQPAPGGPAVLPPGHGAVRAGRRHRRLLPGRVRRRRAGRAGRLLRRADRGERRGRRGTRAERGQRRAPRRPARPRRRRWPPSSPRAASSRCRWTCQNSAKPGAAPSAALWNSGHERGKYRDRSATGRPARPGRGAQRAQLPPAARRDRRGRGRLGDRRRGPPLPGHARGLLGAQLRAPPSRPDRRRAAAAGPGDPGQPGLRARPVRAVLRGAGRAGRHGDGAADEHRRGGGGNGDQDRPQVGLRGQGRARGRGRHRGVRGQLPRPDHDDHQLLHRPRRPGLVRPVHARIPRGAVRGRRTRWPRPSTTAWSGCWSSRSRARQAWWCRRRASWPPCASCAPRTAR